MDGKDHLKDGTLASPHLGFLPLGRLACAAGLLFLAGSGVAGTQMAQVELSIFKLVSASAEIGTGSKTPKEHQISLYTHSHTELTSHFPEVKALLREISSRWMNFLECAFISYCWHSTVKVENVTQASNNATNMCYY